MSPKQAREFIAGFRIEGQGQLTYIETDKGRRLEFDKLSDEEAVDVALLLADLQLDIDKRKGKRQ